MDGVDIHIIYSGGVFWLIDWFNPLNFALKGSLPFHFYSKFNMQLKIYI